LLDGYVRKENEESFLKNMADDNFGAENTLDLKKFFSVETALGSKIGNQTPSTFMRRSLDFGEIDQNEKEQKDFTLFGWIIDSYKIDIENVKTVCNFDAYIYVSYLKMSAKFFAVLSILNLV